MPVVAVVGGQWGDEGKGKVVDLLAGDADVVVRAHGGDNAGHTVVNEQGEFALHLVPAGIFNPDARCIIGPGVALNPAVLIQELDALERRGVSTRGLLISDRAHMVLAYHMLMDRAQEELKEELGSEAIGTTGRGIGPAYGDKVERIGLRVGDLRDQATLRHRLQQIAEHKNAILKMMGRTERISADQLCDECATYAQRLGPYIRDVAPVVAEAVEQGSSILLEGAHGTLLDLDHGTYPYATTSFCTVAGLCQGSGIPPRAISHAVGVYKAYSTRVGGGPMPTELLDETGSYLREHAHEFGTTTGRARRCGWFDGVSSRYSSRINGFDSIAVTRLDILDEMPSIKLCIAYELDGVRLEYPPADPAQLARCRPILEEMPGWGTSICNVGRFEDLPENAAKFVHRIEELVGTRAEIIGVGPARTQTISRKSLWTRRTEG